MSASKLSQSDIFNPLAVQNSKAVLSLDSKAFRIRKNGIEFKTADPLAAWTEMTVQLQMPGDQKKVNCSGVVVACNGNRHSGYIVSLLFTSLSKQSQARLNSLAFASA